MGVLIRIGDVSFLPPLQVDPPTNLSASGITSTGAILSWGHSLLGNKYLLQRSTSEDFSENLTARYSGPANNFSETGLETGTVYYYRVRASLSNNFPSYWSDTFSFTPSLGNALIDIDTTELADLTGEILIDI